jgi:hypothetical protein
MTFFLAPVQKRQSAKVAKKGMWKLKRTDKNMLRAGLAVVVRIRYLFIGIFIGYKVSRN